MALNSGKTLSSDDWQYTYLFPYLLGEIDFLDESLIKNYNHEIKWTTSYPRKLNADNWMMKTNNDLYTHTNGMAYIEEDLNSFCTPEFGVYGRHKVFPFIVVKNNNGNGTLITKFYFDPESPQLFHRLK